MEWLDCLSPADNTFPITYKQQPPYAPRWKRIEPGRDQSAGEKAMEITAALQQETAGELPVKAGVQAISPVPGAYQNIAAEVLVAQFGTEPGELSAAWRAWQGSLGNVEESRFFPLPGNLVRYEIKSVHESELHYRVGVWRQVWADGTLREFAPVEEALAHSPKAWFRDVTAAAFANAPSFHEQLLPGAPNQ